MKKIFIMGYRGLMLILLLLFLSSYYSSGAYADQWAKAYGGMSGESANYIQQTLDGGYIVAGHTSSFGAGNYDVWVLKLDGNGNVEWQKTYGESGFDYAFSIQQTSDEGYIVAGYTSSFGAGNYDVWVLKLDGNGNVEWQKIYGESGFDYAFSIQQTSDEGYIVGGYTNSFGAGNGDIWVLKLDGDGNILWQKTYGGSSYDTSGSIQQTSDGGYIVVGLTWSFGAGLQDGWVLKLDGDGNILWQKTYGGTNNDSANFIQQTLDGGYIVGGSTASFGEALQDGWVLKLDGDGNILWQNAYDWSSGNDFVVSVQQTSDGGYVVPGITYALGSGLYDKWILKLNGDGTIIEWQNTCGDFVNSIQQTLDGGYIAAGEIGSFGAGNYDTLVLKLDANGNIPDCPIIGTLSMTFTDTEATVKDTSVEGVDTMTPSQISSGTVFDTNVTVTVICYYGLPDLIVQSITTDPVSPVAGQTVNVTVTIKNKGGSADGAFQVDFYKHRTSPPVPNAGGDFYCSKGSLAAGTTDTCTGTVTFASAGTYKMYAQVDTDQQVTESDETNNVLGPQDIIVQALIPDLIETSVSNPPGVALAGSSFLVTDTVKNQGYATSRDCKTRYYLSVDTIKSTEDRPLIGRFVPPLAPGATSTKTKNVRIPYRIKLGTYYLLACTDDTKVVTENNESNNCIASSTTMQITH